MSETKKVTYNERWQDVRLPYTEAYKKMLEKMKQEHWEE